MSEDDVWFRIGHALERGRQRLPVDEALGASRAAAGAGGASRARHERPSKAASAGRRGPSTGDSPASDSGREAVEALLLSAGGAAAARLLGSWPGRGRPGPLRLVKAGMAGAGAALGSLLVRTLVRGGGVPTSATDGLADRLRERAASGAARGLLYAWVVEPRVPGPPVLRGLAYGALEHVLAPWGGLDRVLGPASPRHRLAVLSSLLDPDAPSDPETLEDHLLFGALLAELYD